MALVLRLSREERWPKYPTAKNARTGGYPDDETIGASVPLVSLSDSWVLFLTDGAPKNPALRSSHREISREAYAQMRSIECRNALACAGVSTDRTVSFNCVDQEAIYNISELVDRLVSLLKELRPKVIVTHPYEGGHPDHDAAALISSIALDVSSGKAGRLQNAPLLVEMSSYHAVNQRLRVGEFLYDSSPVRVLELTEEESERKRSMLPSYAIPSRGPAELQYQQGECFAQLRFTTFTRRLTKANSGTNASAGK